MDNVFNGCSALTTLDLSHFNTAQVTSMANIFNGCSHLAIVNLSSFNTTQITNMDNWFNGCSALTTLDLRSFTTTQVTSMINLFNGCTHMHELRLDSFNMNNVTPANYANMVQHMADYGATLDDPCTVYCTSDVEDKILATYGSGNYYSGLDESDGGNYATKRVRDETIPPYGGWREGKSIIFARP